MPEDQEDKANPKKDVTPIWSRLEKILEKTESSATNNSPFDVMSYLNLKLQVERVSLELSITSVTDNNRTTHYPPNLKLAETLSNYICSRLGLPVAVEK